MALITELHPKLRGELESPTTLEAEAEKVLMFSVLFFFGLRKILSSVCKLFLPHPPKNKGGHILGFVLSFLFLCQFVWPQNTQIANYILIWKLRKYAQTIATSSFQSRPSAIHLPCNHSSAEVLETTG